MCLIAVDPILPSNLLETKSSPQPKRVIALDIIYFTSKNCGGFGRPKMC